MAKLVVDEMELKASIYDYVMSHIMDKDFENIAAVAEDIRKIVINIAKTPSDDYETTILPLNYICKKINQ